MPKPNLGDLCDLIDAAAKCGSAGIPDSAAGSFLQTIAKMAFKEIAGNEKTCTGDEPMQASERQPMGDQRK